MVVSDTSGSLNPTWVEWLMGFPAGWTRLDHDTPDPHHGWHAEPPDTPRIAHKIPNRADRLRALGNAVVPQVAQYLGQQIQAHQRRTP